MCLYSGPATHLPCGRATLICSFGATSHISPPDSDSDSDSDSGSDSDAASDSVLALFFFLAELMSVTRRVGGGKEGMSFVFECTRVCGCVIEIKGHQKKRSVFSFFFLLKGISEKFDMPKKPGLHHQKTRKTKKLKTKGN